MTLKLDVIDHLMLKHHGVLFGRKQFKWREVVALIERSRTRQKTEGGTSGEEMRRQLGQ